jgi:hypothetical protein
VDIGVSRGQRGGSPTVVISVFKTGAAINQQEHIMQKDQEKRGLTFEDKTY